MRTLFLAGFAVIASAFTVRAAESIPPKPAGYFNDYAGVVSKEAARRFNEQLAQFERDTSNQVLVAVFRKMESDSSIDDYTQRVAQAWGIGQKDRGNGAVLFVFIEDRKMFIQVGYGLEGTLPDVTAFDITERHIKPRFRTNDFEGGLATGIDLVCKAIRGEYTGLRDTNLAHPSTKDARARAVGTGCCGSVLFIMLAIIAVFVLNIALLVWVARDAKNRGMDNSVMWMIFVFFTSLVGLIIYIFSRPQGELVPCPTCKNKRLAVSAKCPQCGNP